jgi:hypothetical protein
MADSVRGCRSTKPHPAGRVKRAAARGPPEQHRPGPRRRSGPGRAQQARRSDPGRRGLGDEQGRRQARRLVQLESVAVRLHAGEQDRRGDRRDGVGRRGDPRVAGGLDGRAEQGVELGPRGDLEHEEGVAGVGVRVAGIAPAVPAELVEVAHAVAVGVGRERIGLVVPAGRQVPVRAGRLEEAVAVDVLDAVLAAVAVGVGVERIRLARVDHAVAVGVLAAVEQAVPVGVGCPRIRFARVDDAVAVGILAAVRQAVVVRVGVERIRVRADLRPVVDPVVVGVRVVRVRAEEVLAVVGQAVAVSVHVGWDDREEAGRVEGAALVGVVARHRDVLVVVARRDLGLVADRRPVGDRDRDRDPEGEGHGGPEAVGLDRLEHGAGREGAVAVPDDRVALEDPAVLDDEVLKPVRVEPVADDRVPGGPGALVPEVEREDDLGGDQGLVRRVVQLLELEVGAVLRRSRGGEGDEEGARARRGPRAPAGVAAAVSWRPPRRGVGPPPAS